MAAAGVKAALAVFQFCGYHQVVAENYEDDDDNEIRWRLPTAAEEATEAAGAGAAGASVAGSSSNSEAPHPAAAISTHPALIGAGEPSQAVAAAAGAADAAVFVGAGDDNSDDDGLGAVAAAAAEVAALPRMIPRASGAIDTGAVLGMSSEDRVLAGVSKVLQTVQQLRDKAAEARSGESPSVCLS
jgi:hypothetical protein